MHDRMDLLEQFVRLEWLLHWYHQRNHKVHGPMGDPHRGQGRVLSMLKIKPQISQKELSYLLNMQPQSLGELLGKLERAGYITRTPSEADRRVVDIKLTEKGAEVANESEVPSDFSALFDCLTQEEQTALGDYLSRIIAEIEKQLGDEPEGFGIGWRDRLRGRLREEDFGPQEGGFGERPGFGRPPFGGPFDPRRGRGR